MPTPEGMKRPEEDEFVDERKQALDGVIEGYLEDEDREFLEGIDESERIGYVYGRLLEQGEDPDKVLQSGVLERTDEV